MRTSTTSRSRSRSSLAAVALALTAAACSTTALPAPGGDTSLEGISLEDVRPHTLVPGSVLVAHGRSFLGPPWGLPHLRLRGTFEGYPIDTTVPMRFVDYDRLEVDIDDDFFDAMSGEEGDFAGELAVEIESGLDGEVYATDSVAVTLKLRPELAPELTALQTGGVIFVNDRIAVQGDGLLLGGTEGSTLAVVEGCFTPVGETDCAPVTPTDVPVVPETAFDRTRGTFMFRPSIAGIRPGRFEGTVALRNEHAFGASSASPARSVAYDLVESSVFAIDPEAVSLGQYVTVKGGGFVGGADAGDTLLQMRGTFEADAGPTQPVDLVLVPQFVDGSTVRYVVNEDDALGRSIDLRRDTGIFSGTVTPIVSFESDQVTGDPATFVVRVAPVKQVVYVEFLPSYVESLRAFGLRAVDGLIRERVLEVALRAYEGVNLELRSEEPDDFAVFSRVEIAGPDPNGLGLFGYDNTPGKDVGNTRLYDRVGGVNALTQEDGYPGFGGVFIESLFGFSMHPGDHAVSLPAATPLFDELFDPFRPDLDGTPVSSRDVPGDGLPPTDGADCPSSGPRSTQIACAVHALAALIGTTTAHEVGHSLGLANPYGDGFHNIGDAPNRLMDAGAARSFTERAELLGDGPAIFCDDEYTYLRQILPTGEPADEIPRPSCF